MSLASIKPYFRARMNALGFTKEHPEAFDAEEVPSTIIDKTFHILNGPSTFVSNNQNHLVMTVDVGMQIFFKGYRDEEQGRLRAESALESILRETLTATNRVTQASDGIKDVKLTSAEIIPMDESQDNISLLQMEFSVDYTLDFE